MTVIVGILCSDGVVVASDSAATFSTGIGNLTIGQQPMQKIHVVNNQILFATSGDVGLAQSTCHAIEKLHETKGKKFSGEIATKDAMALAIGQAMIPTFEMARNAQAANLPPQAIIGGALCETIIAAPVDGRVHLYTFNPSGHGTMATKQLPFVAIGSGQAIADPFLAFLRKIFFPEQLPSLALGTFAAVWTIEHVKATNSGGVSGDVQVATLENHKDSPTARRHKPEKMGEHLQNVVAVEKYLAGFSHGQKPEGEGVALPEPPPTPTKS